MLYSVIHIFFFYNKPSTIPERYEHREQGAPYYFQYQRYIREFPDVDPSKSNNPGFNLLKIPMIMKLTDQSQK